MELEDFSENEYDETVGEVGISEFSAAIGQAVAQGIQAGHAPSQDATQAVANEAHARAVIARNPGMQSDDGAQTAVGLAQHVAVNLGHPELANDLSFVEMIHQAAEGAAAGIGRPVVPIEQQIVAGSSTGNRRGANSLPFG